MKKMNGYKAELKTESNITTLDELDLPLTVNWVTVGAVTGVKN